MEGSLLHHVCIVLLVLWLLSTYNWFHPVAYFISLIYLYLVHERYVMRLRKRVQFEERRQANQRRVLSDSETVRWLNHAVEKMWSVCMEQIVSQKVLLPIVPWFLHKYKPWTVKDAAVQHLYMGRSPPMFTDIRVLRQSCDDDHLALELGMKFLTADDMSAILAVKLRRRVGLGMWAKLHLTGMHVEGKVLVGVKFLRRWPFISRLRVCFVEPPYFQLTVKPLVAHGLDVTELPGIAGWLDKLLAIAFEQTLVEPNMLVVDVEKFASPEPENWFTVDAKEPIAHALVEVLEASDMKPSDMNGLADPYIKGQLGPYRFRTKTQKKTLSPKWHEEFKIPIISWESGNVLAIEVRDKDHFVDDTLGDCSVCISEDIQDGQRHEMWLPLQNIKMGRVHLAITVIEVTGKGDDQTYQEEPSTAENSFSSDAKLGDSSGLGEKSPKMADEFEPIDYEGKPETGIWVQRPGTEVAQVWEPRKGKDRLMDSKILGERGSESVSNSKSSAQSSCGNVSSSTDESQEGDENRSKHRVRRGLQKVKTVFRRNSGKEDRHSSFESLVSTPRDNIRSTNDKGTNVKFVIEDNLSSPGTPKVEGRDGAEGNNVESPNKGHMKDMAKSILKHAGNSARGLKSALSRKGSNKTKGELGSIPAGCGDSAGSDSSEEDVLPIPVKPGVELNTVVANPVSESGFELKTVVAHPVPAIGCDSFKSDEHIIQDSSNNPSLENPVGQVNGEEANKMSSNSIEGGNDAVVQEHVTSNPKSPEGDGIERASET
ncbi:hypothetical protein ACET3Z_018387 [Daucus carota]